MDPDNVDAIEFSLSGLQGVLEGFRQVQQAAAQTGKSVTDSLKNAGRGGRPPDPSAAPRAPRVPRPVVAPTRPAKAAPAAGVKVRAAGAAPAAKAPKERAFTAGPRQRLAGLTKHLSEAQAAGNSDAIKDLTAAIDRLSKEIGQQDNPSPARYPSGPRQALTDARSQVARARQGGDEDAVRDAEGRVRRLQRQVDREDAPEKPARLVSGPRQRLAEQRTQAVGSRQTGNDDAAQDAEARVRRLERQIAREDAPEKAPRFAPGPRQRLTELQSQLAQAKRDGKEDAARDVEGHIRRAKRQVDREEQPEQRPRFVQGPRQRLRDLHSQMQSALKSGDESKIGDVHDAMRRNEQQLKRSQPKNFGGRLMDVVKTTRLNVGEASPLVGRTLALLGPEIEALAGPIGLVVGAATAGAQAVWKLAESAAEAGNAFTRFQIATGSNGQTSAVLQRYGTAAGLSPDRVAAVGQNIQNRISSDPAAQAAGLRLGVFNLPGVYGDQDYGRQEATVLKNLRAEKDPNERLRLARAVGAEDLLPAANTSARQQAYEKPDADVRAKVMTATLTQESADFQDATGRVSDAVQNLIAALGPAVLPRIIDFLNGLATGIEDFASFVMRNQETITKVIAWTADTATVLGVGPGNRLTASERLLSGESGTDAHAAALKENTAATKENTDATQKAGIGAPGSYGNITRQGVTGEGMNGYAYTKAAEAGGYILSAV